jgi:hypothetical protein
MNTNEYQKGSYFFRDEKVKNIETNIPYETLRSTGKLAWWRSLGYTLNGSKIE